MEKDLDFEQRITNWLLLRSSLEEEVGLYYGKMGLTLFFAHYFKHTDFSVYDDTASELMCELVEEIHKESPINFASGLAGIGWGIEYLIQNGFSTGNSLELCEEIDKKIMERDPRRITDLSLDTGLEGLLHYVLIHIKSVIIQSSTLPFDAMYLECLYQSILSLPRNIIPTKSFTDVCNKYKTFHENKIRIDYLPNLSLFIEDDIIIDNDKLDEFPLGLKNGLAGYLLKTIL